MIVGVPKETFAGERRAALVPAALDRLAKINLDVVIEAGAGSSAGFSDEQYEHKGARIATRGDALAADVVLQVRALGANPEGSAADLEVMKSGAVLVAQCEPLSQPEQVQRAAERGITAFAMELIPRISRAQSMDVLSSMASIAGYKSVLMAANTLSKMFPMMITAAGTITPAKVFVVGAGVAGLQAISTARRLGAVVEAYDVRAAVKQEVESLGATFIELELETSAAEGKGGYAKALDEDFYRRQREMMLRVVAESDVVITTAAVPGKKAPILLTREMVDQMKPGAVVIDLAAERGGNCELTQPGETAMEHGVAIVGPVNLPSTIPFHASQMYARNLSNFLLLLAPEGEVNVNLEDEIIRETLLCHQGEVAHPMLRERLGLEPAAETQSEGS